MQLNMPSDVPQGEELKIVKLRMPYGEWSEPMASEIGVVQPQHVVTDYTEVTILAWPSKYMKRCAVSLDGTRQSRWYDVAVPSLYMGRSEFVPGL